MFWKRWGAPHKKLKKNFQKKNWKWKIKMLSGSHIKAYQNRVEHQQHIQNHRKAQFWNDFKVAWSMQTWLRNSVGMISGLQASGVLMSKGHHIHVFKFSDDLGKLDFTKHESKSVKKTKKNWLSMAKVSVAIGKLQGVRGKLPMANARGQWQIARGKLPIAKCNGQGPRANG